MKATYAAGGGTEEVAYDRRSAVGQTTLL